MLQNLLQSFRPGLIQLEIGVQSTNEATIEEIHRKMSLDRLKEVVRRIQSFGNIHQHLDLIAGLPFETYERFSQSFDEIYALEPNQLQMGFLKVLKGSYMYEHAAEYGVLYHDTPPYEVIQTKWLSFADILRMKQIEEMLEVYYNSGQYEVTMRVLRHLFPSAYTMFEKMGAFYEEKGYFGMSHSRIRRCEILMEFIEREWAEREDADRIRDCVREALVFDLYYRENSKSRPDWAPDAGAFKKVTHFYCKNGKLSHVEPFHYDFLGEPGKMPEYSHKEFWVRFSYNQRNPLTHQAKTEYVCPEEDMISE